MEMIVAAIEKTIEVPLVDAIGFFFCTLAGVMVNWLYKCRREGITMSSYSRESIGQTIVVMASAIAAFITTLIVEPGVGKISYFAIGIAADSMLNKPVMPLAVRTALDRMATLQNGGNPDDVPANSGNSVNPTSTDGVHDAEAVATVARTAIEEIGKNYVTGQLTPKAESKLSNGT